MKNIKCSYNENGIDITVRITYGKHLIFTEDFESLTEAAEFTDIFRVGFRSAEDLFIKSQELLK